MEKNGETRNRDHKQPGGVMYATRLSKVSHAGRPGIGSNRSVSERPIERCSSLVAVPASEFNVAKNDGMSGQWGKMMPAPQSAGAIERMSCRNQIGFSVCVGWLGCVLSGCAPAAPGRSGDQRELHFMLGANRVKAMDYRGAIQAFQESLDVDPHSAAAHFELGWLFDQKVPDPAAAIYHYEQYLKLEPDAGNAAAVRQRIEACKQGLAADVLELPGTPAEERQLEELAARHRQLLREIRRLRAEWKDWSARHASLTIARTDSSLHASNPPVAPPAGKPGSAPVAVRPADRLADPAPRRVGLRRTHTVVAGETAFGIARLYRVPLETLLAANPGLEPKRMAVGLVLNIPST